jgi:hypothetical protein
MEIRMEAKNGGKVGGGLIEGEMDDWRDGWRVMASWLRDRWRDD